MRESFMAGSASRNLHSLSHKVILAVIIKRRKFRNIDGGEGRGEDRWNKSQEADSCNKLRDILCHARPRCPPHSLVALGGIFHFAPCVAFYVRKCAVQKGKRVPHTFELVESKCSVARQVWQLNGGEIPCKNEKKARKLRKHLELKWKWNHLTPESQESHIRCYTLTEHVHS